MFKDRKRIPISSSGCMWWTYEERGNFYLMANDYRFAIFHDKHDCEVFERDFNGQDFEQDRKKK